MSSRGSPRSVEQAAADLQARLATLSASLQPGKAHGTYSGEQFMNQTNLARTQENYTQAKAKLDALGSVFDDFHKKLELETELRRDDERFRFKELKEMITKIEKNLNSEIKRRVDSNKSMQTLFESEINNTQKKLEVDFHDRTQAQQTSIEGVTNKIYSLETHMHQQNEMRIKEIQEVGSNFLKQLGDFKQTFEAEKNARVEREAQIVKRLGDEMFRVREKLEKEKAARETGLKSIEEAVDGAAKIRAANIDKFQSELLEEIAFLKNDLQSEVKVREGTEESIVDSLNRYVTAFREGIQIVSK